MPARQAGSAKVRAQAKGAYKALPEPRPVNPGGMELPDELMRRVRRGIEQINRGEYRTFKTKDAAMRFIFESDK